jgi:hypothetical protein
MRGSMMLQADQVTECLVTNVTLVRSLLIDVGASRVHLETVRRAKLFLALVTLVGDLVGIECQVNFIFAYANTA